jgi:hypothetical protein
MSMANPITDDGPFSTNFAFSAHYLDLHKISIKITELTEKGKDLCAGQRKKLNDRYPAIASI